MKISALNLLRFRPTNRKFVGAIVISFSFVTLANATDESETDAKNKVDWSKPIVSRGFGHSSEAAEAGSISKIEYQKGEIAYFFGNYSEAINRWLPLAKQGVSDAQANIGWMYQNGMGVKSNLVEAKAWYEKAATQQHSVAMNNLGVLYEKGYGVTVDLQMAFDLYQQSAKLGYRFGQFNLGRFYWEGLATAVDHAQAKQWFDKAYQQGVKDAQSYLVSTD